MTDLVHAADLLRNGGLVAFPTETVYGLGANALDPVAVARIFVAKGRPATNPLIVHASTIDDVKRVVAEWPAVAQQLAERFWPGPLTLVLRKHADVPDTVTAGGPTVAVRIPAHSLALELLRLAGVPVAAPSANRSTEVSPTRAEHVPPGLADFILDGGACTTGIESTVIDVTESPPRLLRPGPIAVAQLEAVVGRIDVTVKQEAGLVRSPGQSVRHYSPKASLELAGPDRAVKLVQPGRRVAWVAWSHVDASGATVVKLPNDPVAYAANLYAVLHSLDSVRIAHIVVEPPPETDAWHHPRSAFEGRASVDAGHILTAD